MLLGFEVVVNLIRDRIRALATRIDAMSLLSMRYDLLIEYGTSLLCAHTRCHLFYGMEGYIMVLFYATAEGSVAAYTHHCNMKGAPPTAKARDGAHLDVRPAATRILARALPPPTPKALPSSARDLLTHTPSLTRVRSS